MFETCVRPEHPAMTTCIALLQIQADSRYKAVREGDRRMVFDAYIAGLPPGGCAFASCSSGMLLSHLMQHFWCAQAYLT